MTEKEEKASRRTVSQSRESRRIRLLSSAHYWLGICWWLAGLAGLVEGRTAEHEGVVALSPRLGSLSQLTRLCVRGCEHTPVVPPPSEWPCSRATQTPTATSTRAPPGSTALTRSLDMPPPDPASRRPAYSGPKVSHSTNFGIFLGHFRNIPSQFSLLLHATWNQKSSTSLWQWVLFFYLIGWFGRIP